MSIEFHLGLFFFLLAGWNFETNHVFLIEYVQSEMINTIIIYHCTKFDEKKKRIA